jgi:hypothetical protein
MHPGKYFLFKDTRNGTILINLIFSVNETFLITNITQMGYLRNLEISILLLKDFLRVGAYYEHIF